MKRMLGIVTLAMALSATASCAPRGYGRFGPPPPPPPPREAMAVRGHAGLVWVPGHYRWTGKHYKWIKGRWVKPPRPGMIWVPGYRAPRGGAYVWIEGYWR